MRITLPCLLKILKRTRKRYQDPVLWGHGPEEYQLLHNTLSPVIFFQLNTLTGTAKAPAIDILRLNILGGFDP